MRILTSTALLALALAAGSAVAVPTAQPSVAVSIPATQPSQDVSALIRQLGADDFHARREAGQKLKEIGKAAVPALKEARQSKDPEIQSRAEALLQEIEEPPVVVEAVPQPTGVGGAHSMSMSITNGTKTIDVHEDGRMTHIEESALGIKMTVTGQIDDKEVTRDFKATSAAKLQKQNPAAFALYQQYAGVGGNGIGGFRIQAGGVGINNINIRMNVNANGVAIGPNALGNGLLGISVGEAAAPGEGVPVTQVFPGSRAEKMGIKEKDVIQKVNGKDVHSVLDLRQALLGNRGIPTVVEASRDGKPITLSEAKKADPVEVKVERKAGEKNE